MLADIYSTGEVRDHSRSAKKVADFDTLSFDSDESFGECQRLCHRELQLPSQKRQSMAPWREAEKAVDGLFALDESPETCAVDDKRPPVIEGADAQVIADLRMEVSFLTDVVEDYGNVLTTTHAKGDASVDDKSGAPIPDGA
eukprot:GEMP01056732.1.p1 GENE.GEMP01056732.1~~GEMP01056732.1.p1  ORF type:complete len:142 (+),score=34.85 GEMP01056732.1:118-543(+)